jgi:hypothetical protein
MKIETIPRATVDAMNLVDLFSTLLARSAMYSNETLRLAAEYLASNRFNVDSENEAIIKAFINYLREQGED